MREVVTSTDILLANSNHPYFLIMDWSNKIALLRIPTECILTKRLESMKRRYGKRAKARKHGKATQKGTFSLWVCGCHDELVGVRGSKQPIICKYLDLSALTPD
jgi:hypothetical protein